MTKYQNGRRRNVDGIVIAGGGLAAQRCAETLRRSGSDQPIRMLCAESHRPYDRPPLSKELLLGDGDATDLAYRPESWYAANAIDLLPGVAAGRLRPDEHRLDCSDGTALRYSRLLIATGGTPRGLPGLAGDERVLTLRTVDDAVELRRRLLPGTRLLIVGAGFVGLELAATARRLGVEVTLVEAGPAPLANLLGERLGDWFAELHRSHGVAVLTGRTVARLQRTAGGERVVDLSDGSAITADQIVVGVGTDPDIGWLHGSGLDLSRGVRVDRHGASSCPDVFAAGDAAETYDPASGAYVPGSHWEAAARQGADAARLMLGLGAEDSPPASFWTDQYGLRIQYVGRAGAGDLVTLDGDPAARNFSATFTRAGRATAVLLVDRPRSLPAARNLLERQRQ